MFLCRGNLTALAQDVTQHGPLVWLLADHVCVRMRAATVQHLTLAPFTHMPLCSAHCLCCEAKAASVSLDRTIRVQLKCLYQKQEIKF